MYRRSKPGKRYVMRADVVNTGFPYSDVFYIVNHYCINKVSEKKCHLLISCEVVYRKQTWGLVKCKSEGNMNLNLLQDRHFKNLNFVTARSSIKREDN